MSNLNILDLEVKPNKILMLKYSNGERRLFDVKPYIEGTWYGELNDDSYFKTVRIVNGGKGIEWSHGQDIAPHELYECSKAV